MTDQAHGLRNLISQDDAVCRENGRKGPPVVAILGGKGGVGTTTLAVNLAAYVASQQIDTALVQIQFLGCLEFLELHVQCWSL